MDDLAIARAAPMRPIAEVARDRLSIPPETLELFGRHKAKVPLAFLEGLRGRPQGRLVLVTGMTPTPAGEGKTTTTIGLTDGLNRIGKRAALCLREPSLGPFFGMKGGATGGGRAQIVPMEEINLHFTGDFHAVTLAHNLLAALIDNHLQHGNDLDLDSRRIPWRRVMDLNDRSLRSILVGLGGTGNGLPRETGFDITAASEVMAILCLADSLPDLKDRLGRIIAGTTRKGLPVCAKELQGSGAMAVVLRDAIRPNLVQTLEGSPAFVHGGPFGNLAHGCSSVLATRAALALSDYVVTEAGFGADLGGEKFVDIKCRVSGLRPALAVLVATVRALKYHGGAELSALPREDLAALEKGIPNLERHVNNVRNHYGLPCVVAVNCFSADTDAEMDLLRRKMAHHGVPVVAADHHARGGAGAEELARAVVRTIEEVPSDFRFVYDDDDGLFRKLTKVATKIYGASEVVADTKIRARIKKYEAAGYGRLPVCFAKTQYSFSTDPRLRGAPSGHVVPVRDVYLAAGSGFLVAVCGDILTMPGLPKESAAAGMDLDDAGRLVERSPMPPEPRTPNPEPKT